jgi:hypothetical protein
MARGVLSAAKTVVRALAIAIVAMLAGWLVSAVCFGVGFWLLSSSEGAGFHGAGTSLVGAVLGLLVLFRDQPWAMSSLVAGLGGLLLHAALAQKFVLQSLMHSLWKAGESRVLEPVVSRSVAALDKVSPGWMTGAVKWTTLKASLLVAMRRDSQMGFFQKWVLGKILGKLSLKDELPTDREGLSRFLVERIRAFTGELIAPSLMLPGIVMGGQLLLAILSLAFGR